MPTDYIENYAYENENEGFWLRSIDAESHLSECIDADEIIKYNEDLENKLLTFQEEAYLIGTASTLNKGQQ